MVRLEFPDQTGEDWLAAHPEATSLSYGYLLHLWRKAA